MSLLRSAILGVAHTSFVKHAATGGVGRAVALRFVAGEGLDDGLRVVHELAGQGLTVSLDYLGENVSSASEAVAARHMYRDTIQRIGSGTANVSVKLSQLGLDLDEDLAFANASELVRLVGEHDSSLTLDMEDHRYTERTVEMCTRLNKELPGRAGIAIQAYLYRSSSDLERVLDAPVRLCKGAYKEQPAIAFRSKADVDRAYARLLGRLVRFGRYPMIATHDERLIRHAMKLTSSINRDPETFEFQMLYGIRSDLQRDLRARGYRVRVYVPFGGQWYPYLVRRLAERPANLLFFASQLVRKR